MCFIVVCTLIDKDYVSLLFSQTFFRIVPLIWDYALTEIFFTNQNEKIVVYIYIII